MSYTRKPDGVFYDAKQGRLMEHQGYAKRIYWSKDMIDLLMREYPTTFNEEMAGMLGVSHRTMIRKAREKIVNGYLLFGMNGENGQMLLLEPKVIRAASSRATR